MITLSSNNCVPLVITCLNFVGPSDHTTKCILECINTYAWFTPTEVISLAQNHNSAIHRDYTSRRLTRSFRNRRHQNERLWSRFSPQDFKCVYCRDELTLYPNLVGAHSDIRLLLCCCLLAHRDCHPTSSTQEWQISRLPISVWHWRTNWYRCWPPPFHPITKRDSRCPPYSQLLSTTRSSTMPCHLFAHLPTHRPRHSAYVNDPH